MIGILYSRRTSRTREATPYDEVNAGTSKDAGVILGDHSGKAAGTYEDTITFTASVDAEATGPKLSDALVDGATVTIIYTWSTANTIFTFTNDNGTYSCAKSCDEVNDFSGSLTMSGNTLVSSAENAVKSEIDCSISFDAENNTYSITKKDDS